MIGLSESFKCAICHFEGHDSSRDKHELAKNGGRDDRGIFDLHSEMPGAVQDLRPTQGS